MSDPESYPTQHEQADSLPQEAAKARQQRPAFRKSSMMIKAGAILLLTLLLLIPTSWVRSLITEREERKTEVSAEIMSKWAGKQTLCGPVLILPYLRSYPEGQTGSNKTEKSYAYFLPDEVAIKGELQPQILYRSIYTLPVYTGNLTMQGAFKGIPFHMLNIDPQNVLWNEALLSFRLSDVHGIQEEAHCQWNNTSSQFFPGAVPGLEPEMQSKGDMVCGVAISPEQTATKEFHFSINLSVSGAEYLFFLPTGAQTQVHLRSPWKSPAFDGSALPAQRQVDDGGFNATWKVLRSSGMLPSASLSTSSARLYEHLALSPVVPPINAFGVRLVMPLSSYQITTRAVKYAIMVIALSFMLFFFIEVLGNKAVHPFQYILIGLALVIFYSLLLSFSEHWSFHLSYLLAAGMTVLLISFYTLSILKDRRFAFLVGVSLSLLYAFIYTILQMEDYSLMVGSVGLFLCLAAVMYFSRRVDWYGLERKVG